MSVGRAPTATPGRRKDADSAGRLGGWRGGSFCVSSAWSKRKASKVSRPVAASVDNAEDFEARRLLGFRR
jgi:hypothetical protein